VKKLQNGTANMHTESPALARNERMPQSPSERSGGGMPARAEALQLLQSIYALTTAEARLAWLLAEGLSLAEIAGSLRVSRNTLKAQLQAVYSKTGVARQAQLVRLVLFLPVQGNAP
jgi:DNA-binding CsgD family transcriptional regulator